ncbi:hypothetical protein PFICI_13886 [Pestalotiopsis fici W106-1]|uniref:Zinc-regulated transporter 1 n=1 Tax=Pestalotiopsis fici (strain W106-1 / CGMCC3.15140) TaxID=1229662 RepID=W3WJB1_PESFW|nr:uncharacterized protein PFICI_13886 [Pestalotiopsis fici W106-1]ETS74020.1 hypothetical protein PFICI_13886 [Pestalotiopsis fici W106-1]
MYSSIRLGMVWLLPFLAPTCSGSFVARRQGVPAAPAVTAPPRFDAGVVVRRQAEDITAISDCHAHGTEVWCMAGTTEYQVVVEATATSELPASYTGCHSHGSGLYCMDAAGDDVEVLTETTSDAASTDSTDSTETSDSTEELDCHFHAGVEHCVGAEGENGSSTTECARQSRDYNIPLRIGLLFVILVTSFIGVAGPIFIKPVLSKKFDIVFIILKQFGTGVIISTAFVHLYTHASLMFTNECLTGIEYESTTSAIVMAGLFLSFVVDFVSHRIASGAQTKLHEFGSHDRDNIVQVLILEAGIIFHSILIGLTLVVAGDSYFITLFIVILFHQMFEGIALGTRIASVGRLAHLDSCHAPPVSPAGSHDKTTTPIEIPMTATPSPNLQPLSMVQKLLMAAAFSIVTPIGMAIGIGVLQHFNGNDPSTLIALGTLDALSAGILVWVGLVEMWARDWMLAGEMVHAGLWVTLSGGISLVAGMALMSFLGKWA